MNAGLRGEPYDIEHRVVAAGTIKWVREKACLERDREGKLLGGFGITQHITARKLAEDEVRRAEEERRVAEAVRAERQRLFDVLEALPAMICLLTPGCRVAFANRGFRDRFGETRDLPCHLLFFGRPTPCDSCMAPALTDSGQPHRWEVTTPDGTVIGAHEFPFRDADGSPVTLVMATGITKRRRVETSLQTAHEYLSQRAAQLRALAAELTLSGQRERRRLAKIRMTIVGRLGDESTRLAAGEIERLLDESISASRMLTAELSPPILHEAGLPAGLEWIAYYQYWLGAKLIKGPMKDAVAAELNLHATEELNHAVMVAGRITQLGGTPVLKPEGWSRESPCKYDAPEDPYVAVLPDQNIAGEQCAITTYKGLMDATRDKDMVTYNMALTILEQEVEHEEDLQSLREDLELMAQRGSR